MKKIFVIFTCFFLFSFSVCAEENFEELYYDFDSKSMINTLSSGSGSGRIYQDELSKFYTVEYKYTFNLDSKKDFIFDLGIDLLNSYAKTNIVSICFISKCYGTGIYSSGSIYVLGQKHEVNVDNETNLKLHFEYDSSNNVISYSSSNYASINGTVEVIDNYLNYISISNSNNYNYYTKFDFIFGNKEVSKSLNLYEFVNEAFEFLPSEFEIMIPIFTFLLFLLFVICSIFPFILLYLLI